MLNTREAERKKKRLEKERPRENTIVEQTKRTGKN